MLFFVVITGILDSKRGRVTRGSSSCAAPAPNAPNFQNLKFLYEANAEKYLKLVDYHIVRYMEFTFEDLRGFEEVVEILQQWHWVSSNYLIQETNKTTSLDFYANEDFSDVGTYISYVRGKYIDYSTSAINYILNL